MLESTGVIAPGQRRSGATLYPGLVVRVINESPYYPGNWVCRVEQTGCKLVIPANDLGEILPDPSERPPNRA